MRETRFQLVSGRTQPFAFLNLGKRGMAVLMLSWLAVSNLLAQAPAPPAAPAANPTVSGLEAQYNQAMNAFDGGNWSAAIEGLEKLVVEIKNLGEQDRLGPLYFTLGAAYFNLPNYPKAIETFRTYLTEFPNADRVAEARLAAARAMFLNKDHEGAAKLFAQFESFPSMRDEALVAQAECYGILKQPDQQILVLEKLIKPEIASRSQAAGALMLADLYLKQQQREKVLPLIRALTSRVGLVDNVVWLNEVAVDLGDKLADAKEFEAALAAYRGVKRRGEVAAIQKERIAAMDRRIAENLARAKANPQASTAATGANLEIEAQKKAATELLNNFEKLPDYWPAVLLRMGQAWYEWGKQWEALAVFNRVITEYPKSPEHEPALYAYILCSSELNRMQTTRQACDDYMKAYPDGPNVGTVGYITGALAMQNNDLESAVSFFGIMLEKQPTSKFREEMRFLLGNAHFLRGEYELARKQYQIYAKDYPEGGYLQEAIYRDALTLIFEGKFTEAQKAFDQYLYKYPKGAFAADAAYRVMFCKYSNAGYGEVVHHAPLWQRRFPNDPMTGEVLSLLGDALAAQNKTAEAADTYVKAYKAATTDEVMNYALFEAGAQLRKLGQWEDVSALFQDFVKENPDHPMTVAAMYWIGKSKAREGKIEEAKTFLVDNIKPHINEPSREAVEQMLQQLAQLCSRRPPLPPVPEPEPAAEAAPEQPAAEAPAPPPLPPYDAVAELKKHLAPLAAIANETGKARLLYAELELYKLIKRNADVPGIWTQISTKFLPKDLSPALLAEVGDFCLATGDESHAAKVFTILRESYPRSDFLDYAYVGLGQMALKAKDPQKAFTLFNYAVNEIAGAKLKEATIGLAQTQLELGKYDEAKTLFEDIAVTREWRGEATALSIFYMGEVASRRERWAEAITHYERVSVAYQRYRTWAARSYIQSAKAHEKLGKRDSAIASLRELVQNEKFKNVPEVAPELAEAKKLLAQWGAS